MSVLLVATMDSPVTWGQLLGVLAVLLIIGVVLWFMFIDQMRYVEDARRRLLEVEHDMMEAQRDIALIQDIEGIPKSRRVPRPLDA